MGKVLNMLSSNGASPEQMVRRICGMAATGTNLAIDITKQ